VAQAVNGSPEVLQIAAADDHAVPARIIAKYADRPCDCTDMHR